MSGCESLLIYYVIAPLGRRTLYENAIGKVVKSIEVPHNWESMAQNLSSVYFGNNWECEDPLRTPSLLVTKSDMLLLSQVRSFFLTVRSTLRDLTDVMVTTGCMMH